MLFRIAALLLMAVPRGVGCRGACRQKRVIPSWLPDIRTGRRSYRPDARPLRDPHASGEAVAADDLKAYSRRSAGKPGRSGACRPRTAARTGRKVGFVWRKPGWRSCCGASSPFRPAPRPDSFYAVQSLLQISDDGRLTGDRLPHDRRRRAALRVSRLHDRCEPPFPPGCGVYREAALDAMALSSSTACTFFRPTAGWRLRSSATPSRGVCGLAPLRGLGELVEGDRRHYAGGRPAGPQRLLYEGGYPPDRRGMPAGAISR